MRGIVAVGSADMASAESVDLPDAVPGHGQVRVSVYAAGVNEPVPQSETGAGASRVCSFECAGVISQLGSGVAAHWFGARVMAMTLEGSYAEQVVVPVRALIPLPDHLSFEQAATVPLAFLTACEALFHRGALLPGETLLLTGTQSAIAQAAGQLALASGAKVLLTQRHERLERQGAILHGDGVVAPTSNRNIDVVLVDKGPYPLDSGLALLAEGGRLLWPAFSRGICAAQSLARVAGSGQAILGIPVVPRSSQYAIALTRRFLRTHHAGFSDGRLEPLSFELFDLCNARDAHQRLAREPAAKKFVLRVRNGLVNAADDSDAVSL